MIIGFTGTQHGMNGRQLEQLQWLLAHFSHVHEFHHGDCVGADAEAHVLAKQQGIPTHVHPPRETEKRAGLLGNVNYAPLTYLLRNEQIVKSCEVLIATPREVAEQLRSGTWATVRHARKLHKIVIILYP